MGAAIKIEGLDDCLKMFENAPKRELKICQKAMKDASRQVVKSIKRGCGAFGKMAAAKVKKARDGGLSATIGLFNKEGGRDGGKVPNWFKAYWANYGTLEGRDPNHKFQYPVKHRGTSAAQNRRNKGGQKARNFFEGAIQGWDDTFVKAFEDSLRRQQDDLLKK